MTTLPRPMCYGCKHLRDEWACDAFPDGIPQPILWSEADHRGPYEGDGGIQFDPKDDESKSYAASLF